jgi:hypothetical protein
MCIDHSAQGLVSLRKVILSQTALSGLKFSDNESPIKLHYLTVDDERVLAWMIAHRPLQGVQNLCLQPHTIRCLFKSVFVGDLDVHGVGVPILQEFRYRSGIERRKATVGLTSLLREHGASQAASDLLIERR